MVTVCLEMPTRPRPHIAAARPRHPSLVDPTHRMGALFGVVNVPSVIWVDEQGTVVRPPEPGWPSGDRTMPAEMAQLPRPAAAPAAPAPPADGPGRAALLNLRAGPRQLCRCPAGLGGARPGQPVRARPPTRSSPAPGRGRWRSRRPPRTWNWPRTCGRAGRRDLAVPHFTAAHRLQPDNWTYRRQAWSLVGQERVGGEFGRFVQGPLPGEEADWPFDSDFASDLAQLGEGEYYPRTL